MTPEKIALVRSSWQQVLPIKNTAAQLFYGRLFELDPSLRHMFKGAWTEAYGTLSSAMKQAAYATA